MSENPWLVDNIQSFLYLNCPECGFKTKMKNYFQDHAIKKHPSSCVFFEKSTMRNEENCEFYEIDVDMIENGDFLKSDKTLEEIMYPEVQNYSDFESKNRRKSLKKRKLKQDFPESKGTKSEMLFHKFMFCEFSSKSLVRFKVHIKRHQNVLPIGKSNFMFRISPLGGACS